MRMSDVILNSLNRFYESKKSGGLSLNELSNLITNIGYLTANLASLGKLDEEQLNDIYNFLPKVNYFDANHTDLDVATNTFIQDTSVALGNRLNRYSTTVPKVDYSYTKGFTRL